MQPGSVNQTEFDFAGADVHGAGANSGNGAAAYLSDEEILGMDDAPHGREAATPAAGSENGADVAAASSPAVLRADAAGRAPGPGAEIRRRDAGATNPSAQPGVTEPPPPAWLRPLLADPKIAPEARELWAHAQQLQAIDAAYFSGEPRAQQELAGWLLRDNPAAFRAMLQQGASVLATSDPAAAHLRALARHQGQQIQTAPAVLRSPTPGAPPRAGR